MENEIILTDGREVAEIFNEYFVNITDSLGIREPENILIPTGELHSAVETLIIKCSSQLSIKLMQLKIYKINLRLVWLPMKWYLQNCKN